MWQYLKDSNLLHTIIHHITLCDWSQWYNPISDFNFHLICTISSSFSCYAIPYKSICKTLHSQNVHVPDPLKPQTVTKAFLGIKILMNRKQLYFWLGGFLLNRMVHVRLVTNYSYFDSLVSNNFEDKLGFNNHPQNL